MTNSGFIAAMGSVAAAIFFAVAAACGLAPRTTFSKVMLVAGLALAAVYLFVSLFWGLRATLLESFQVTKRHPDRPD